MIRSYVLILGVAAFVLSAPAALAQVDPVQKPAARPETKPRPEAEPEHGEEAPRPGSAAPS